MQLTRIAIVGTACRYPDAKTPEDLWENVLAQRRAFRRIPTERLSLADYFSADRTVADAIYSTQAAVLADYDFDRNRFRVAGGTFRAVDMTHWLALEVAADALASAGFPNAEGLPRAETGIYVGNSLTGEFSRANLMRLRWPYIRRVLDAALAGRDWPARDRTTFLCGLEQSYKSPFPPVNDETLAGGLSNTIAGRICNYFDLKGGGYTVDGACASSLLAVATACSALAAGDVEVALAGGIDLSLDPFELIGFSKVGALAADEMRIYDLHSAGFWPGEGCGMLVLMRMEDALRLNRPVLASLCGWGISSDGSGGLTRPEVEGHKLAMARAYRRAGFGIETVGYFEGHGTGTGVGDPTELKALSQARRAEGGAGLPAALGSIKANIGHTKAAAGVAGVLKAAMAVNRRLIPPTTGWTEPHPVIAEEGHQLRLLSEGESWPADRPLRAGVSAMGFGGINAHIVLEGLDEAPRRRTLTPRERRLLGSAQDAELFLFAADSAEDLDRTLQELEPVALRISRSDLTDLAYHLFEKLAPGNVRAALVVSRPQDLANGLKRIRNWLAGGMKEGQPSPPAPLPVGEGSNTPSPPAPLPVGEGSNTPASPAALPDGEGSGTASPTRRVGVSPSDKRYHHIDVDGGVMLGASERPPSIGYLFSGQGTSFHRDGGLWGRRFETVRQLYDFADLPRDGSDAATEIAQPSIITASLAGLDILSRCGVEATVGIGHSLGELAAYHWAGAIDKPALLRLAHARGKAIAQHGRPGGTMASIAAGEETVAPAIAGRGLVLAGLNAPLQTVISGNEAAIDHFVDLMKGTGIAAAKLHVSHAFHSPCMDIAATFLRDSLERERFLPLAARVVSTVTGSRLAAEADLRQILFQQMTGPVRFAEAVGREATEVDLWIEIGPGHVLAGLISRLDDSPAIALDAGGPSLKGLLKAIAAAFALGAPVAAQALFDGRFHRPFDPAHRPGFLANPCEQAPAYDGQPSGAIGPAEDRDNAEARAVSTPTVEAADDISLSARGSYAAPGDDTPAAVAAADKPLDVVRRLAALRAELPLETVGKDLRLLGDLHLSSIAVAQLVTESARALGLEPPIWPTEAANATISEVAEALEQLARSANASPQGGQESLPGIAAWTRPFTVKLVECPPSRHSEVVADKKTDWTIIADENDPLRGSLPALLNREAPGGGVAVCLPPEPDEPHIDFLLQSAREVLAHADRKRFLMVQHGGGAAGFARTLHLERPELAVCVVDVPVGHAAAAGWIAAEASAQRGYVEAHYDVRGTRREPRLRLLDDAAQASGLCGDFHKLEACATGPLVLGPGDVLLVTGGGKGIGAECALALAQASGTRLALVGRSRPEDDAELVANLKRFSDFGVTFHYDAVDVTDKDAVRRAVQGIEERLGPVTGVLHSAGANVPQRLDALDRAAFLRTVKPKVHGLRNVLDAVAADRLRLLVAFGSIIARTGMPGEADYAVANEWLTRLVERWQAEHAHCRCLSIEWSVWSGVGMGERLGSIDGLRRQGISPISPDAGIAVLKELLAFRRAPVAVIVTGRFGEPPTLRFDRPELPLLRFLERIRLLVPGVELIAEADLSLDTDPYLADHVYQGAPLFPAVMGLEAMAQAAKALTQSAEVPAFEGVLLARPIVVPRDGPLTVRLVALQTESNCVEVALRSQETNFQVDHFRARCVFGSAARENDFTEGVVDCRAMRNAALPLDPDRDLYGGILFQRGRLQRVRGYRHLRATECVAEIRSSADTPWFSQYLPGNLVLGDPGARDATMHGIQACIPHGTLLPTGVERITIFAPLAPTVFVHARERSRDGDEFVYDVDVTDESGTVLERWRGLQLRCIRTRGGEGPWAAPLLATHVERRVQELTADATVSVALKEDLGSDRQAAGNGAMRRALGANVAIHRRGDGKPQACVAECVSAAHAGALTLAICGDKTVACDLEAVAIRSRAAWGDLLGSQRQRLADLVAREASEDCDASATRIWSAGECLKKAGLPFEAPLVLASVQADGWAVLESGAFRIATAVVAVRGRQGKLGIALLVET